MNDAAVWLPYILYTPYMCCISCMRWYYSLMPLLIVLIVCVSSFIFFKNFILFLTSASLWLSLLFLCVFVFYDDFSGVNFFFRNFEEKKLIFAQARRFNGFLFTSSSSFPSEDFLLSRTCCGQKSLSRLSGGRIWMLKRQTASFAPYTHRNVIRWNFKIRFREQLFVVFLESGFYHLSLYCLSLQLFLFSSLECTSEKAMWNFTI